jgi:very-short-patch-repair endonuclease
MSPPEVVLWARLRVRAPDSPVFRRQHPIGPYVADFYCAAARLVVEVDGAIHGQDDQIAHDQRRDAYMERLGYRVIRCSAGDVMNDPDEVVMGHRGRRPCAPSVTALTRRATSPAARGRRDELEP